MECAILYCDNVIDSWFIADRDGKYRILAKGKEKDNVLKGVIDAGWTIIQPCNEYLYMLGK